MLPQATALGMDFGAVGTITVVEGSAEGEIVVTTPVEAVVTLAEEDVTAVEAVRQPTSKLLL